MMATALTLIGYERGPAVLHAVVHGLPIPQGSIRSLGRGRPAVHSNADRLKPWRERLFWELRHCVAGQPFPLTSAVAVDVTFTMPKAKNAPKKRRTFPIRLPDTDKLMRAVGDSLEQSGVVSNDSQIVEWCARKVFPGEHPAALSSPGAVVYVYVIGGA